MPLCLAHALCPACALFCLAAPAAAQFIIPTNFVCGVRDGSSFAGEPAAKTTQRKYAGTGARSVLVLRVDFPNAPGAVVSEEQARAELASVDAFFRVTSFQQLSLGTVSVTPVLRLPGDTSSYNTGSLASDARKAAEAEGFDFSSFDFAIYSFPDAGMGFTAVGSIGGKGVWVQGNNFVAYVVAHELGHNLGLAHANAWTAPDDSIVGPGFASEYGNLFDAMGGSPFYPSSGFNANFRYLLGWLRDSDVHLAVTSGVYRVFAMDAGQPLDVSRRCALRVPAAVNLKGVSCDYWIDVRQALAYDRTTNGILVQAAPAAFSFGGNYLLDMTPETPNRHFDAPLVLGRTFADPARGIYITPVKKGSREDQIYLDVLVSRDVPFNQPPVLSVTASALSTNVFQAITFTAHATDPDDKDSELNYFWDFGDGTLATNLNSAEVTKSWYAPGNYLVRCTVSDGRGGSASRSLVVELGTAHGYVVSGRVLLGGVPVQGARVHNGRTGADYRFAWSDSDGFYALTELAADNYSITAVKPGLNIAVRPIAVGPSVTNIDLTALPVSAPFITALSPEHGLLQSTVQMSGANLSGATAVRFGNVEAAFTVLSPTEVTVVVPSGAWTAPISVTTPKGTATSSQPFVLDADAPIEIVRQPSNALVPQGSNSILSIGLFGSGPFGFQWRREGMNLPGAVESTLSLPNFNSDLEGMYSVVVTNPLGSVTSAPAALTVLTIARAVGRPDFTWQTSAGASWFGQTNVWLDAGDASGETLGGGYSAESSSAIGDSWIETTVSGPMRLTFWWQLSARFFDETLDFLVDGSVAAHVNGPRNWSQVSVTLEPGLHVLRWTRHARVAGTKAWLAQVRRESLWFLSQPRGVSTIGGETVMLTATTSVPAAFQWLHGGIEMPGATNAALTFAPATPSDSGDYRVVIRDGLNAATSVVAQVQVAPLEIAAGPVSQEVAATSNALFGVQFASREPVTFRWLFKDAPVSGATNQSLVFRAMPADAGNYAVAVANRYGSVTSSPAVLTVRSMAPAIAGGSATYEAYAGERVSLQVSLQSIPPPGYRWFRNRRSLRGATNSVLTFPKVRATQKGDYVLVAQNPFGVITQHIQLKVQRFVIRQHPTNQDLFVGNPLRLSVAVGSTSPVLFQWRLNGTAIAGATNSQFFIATAQTSDSGDYDVVCRLKGGRATLTSSNAHVTIVGDAPVFTIEPRDTEVRIEEFVTFTSAASGHPAPSFQWYFEDVALPLASGPTLTRFWTSDLGGRFFVVASNAFGAVTSRVALLTVRRGPPTPGISPSDFSTVTGNFIALRAHDRASPPIDGYQWSFNGTNIQNATNSSLIIPSIALDQSGKYRVTASNELGFGTSAGTDITVFEPVALDLWQWVNPLPRADDFRDAAAGDGMFVAVGEGGSLVSSVDGANWQDRSLLTPNTISSVGWVAGRFLVLLLDADAHPALVLSSNLIDWMAAVPPRSRTVRNVSAVNGRFFASGENAQGNLLLCFSDDGNHWTTSIAPLAATNVSLSYGAGRYVGLAAGRALFSTNGIDWIVGAAPLAARQLCFSQGIFLAVGDAGRVWTSIDGIDWRLQSSGTGKDLFCVAFAANRFIAAGEDGRIITSPNGVTWSNAVSNTSQELDAVAVGTNEIALFGKGGVILTSTNGLAWSPRLRGFTDAGLASVLFTNGLFVVVGDSGTILTSADGSGWTNQVSNTSRDLRSLVHGPTGFVAVGDGGTILHSPDGLNWLPMSSPVTNSLTGVAFHDGRYFAVGDAGTILVSSNGVDWLSYSVSLPGLNGTVDSVAYGSGLFVAVGGYEALDDTLTNTFARSVIITSPDGERWTLQTPDFGKKLRNITFVNGRFFALGNDGLIVNSEDGLRWQQQFIAEDFENLRSLRTAAGVLVIVGNNGIVFSSPDGTAWRRHRLFTAKNLHDCAFGQNFLIAVGSDGAVLRADGLMPSLKVTRLFEKRAVEFQSQNGMQQRYPLQYSDDNFIWRDLGLLTNGVPLVDTNRFDAPHGFFRLKWP